MKIGLVSCGKRKRIPRRHRRHTAETKQYGQREQWLQQQNQPTSGWYIMESENDVATQLESIDAYIFYFDLIGVLDAFVTDPQDTLTRLREFHRESRNYFPVGGASSTLKTLADNVWARLNGNEPIADVRILEIAAKVMLAASNHGFSRFFGAVTRSDHEFDLFDRTLMTGGDATDLTIQHIDMTSDAHMRAVLAEKWSAHLAKTKNAPTTPDCVWVSEDLYDGGGTLDDNLHGVKVPLRWGRTFDLARLNGPGGRKWPFPKSKFRPCWPV